ncbi:peptidoglycan DD-metalloendopeptidase family protein [Metabacillus schmidteae]|uniref:peptidoglycan DD-metalloendopeptidase family protein n=1 Tax=Metabacillus schmidteae TaxID=2730405 RepID=UPI001F33D035|nr:M23 family metallopeptidase [Metabacillus schmidteae]
MFNRSTRVLGEERSIMQRSLFKKLTMGVVLATSLTFGIDAQAEDSIATVYHIYHEGKYMGTVDDQKVIEELSTLKINKVKDKYKDLQLTVEDIEIIPEEMFRPVFNNIEVAENLKKELDVVVNATVIEINDQEVAAFQDSSIAQNVLDKYKQKFVSKKELEELASQQATKSLPVLKEGQSRITDVSFTEDVTLETKKVLPEKIMTSQQGLNLLEKGTPVEKEYKVQEDDVLGEIASKHDLSLDKLLDLNPELKEDSVIKPGDLLNVTVLKPYVKVQVQEEVYEKETIAYKTEIKEDSSVPKGEEEVTQNGQDGESLVHYTITKQNGSEIKQEILNEKVLKEPVNEMIIKGTKVIPSRGTGSLAWPAVGGYISSGLGQRWGKLHKGIDIARPSDRTIKAADNGRVISAGYNGGYGNKVVVDHNNGMKTVYAHLSSISVKVGQVVSQGQKLGVMGSTGNSTGIHLHFEVYEDGNLKNPEDYLK